MSDKVNMSGYTCSHYETEMEACPNNPGCEGNPAVCPSCKDWHRAEADK